MGSGPHTPTQLFWKYLPGGGESTVRMFYTWESKLTALRKDNGKFAYVKSARMKLILWVRCACPPGVSNRTKSNQNSIEPNCKPIFRLSSVYNVIKQNPDNLFCRDSDYQTNQTKLNAIINLYYLFIYLLQFNGILNK